MKLNKYFLSLVFLVISVESVAASDSGKIVEIYSHPSGQMALRLDNGLPNSIAVNACGVSSNQWAGVDVGVDPSIKSAILAAYTAKANVILVTLGNCVGGWIKIEAMHVK